eukprot:6459310-Amphidinium_carterae.2
MIHPAADSTRPRSINCTQSDAGGFQCCHLITYSLTATSTCTAAGLLTSFGLDLVAGQMSSPEVDRATLQLVG